MRALRATGASGRSGTGTVLVGGGASRGEDEGAAAVIAATPDIGVAGGGHLSAASLLLSSLRLALLARSRLLLPEGCAWAWVAVLAADVRNHSVTSSPLPSVSNTSLA